MGVALDTPPAQAAAAQALAAAAAGGGAPGTSTSNARAAVIAGPTEGVSAGPGVPLAASLTFHRYLAMDCWVSMGQDTAARTAATVAALQAAGE
jgi:hypothetical protein